MINLTAAQAELKVLGDQLAAKRKSAEEFLSSHKTAEGQYKISDTDYDSMTASKKELVDLHRQYEAKAFEIANSGALEDLNRVDNDLPLGNKSFGTLAKSVGETVTSDERFKNFNPRASSGNVSIEVDGVGMKTLMTESAGFAPPNFRTNIVVMSAQRKLTVLNLLPINETGLTTIKYMVETTATNGAATRAEGAAAAASTLAYTETSVNVVNIAHILPVSEEQLEDVPMVQGLVNDRIGLFLQQKLESKIISGGGGSDMTGILNTSGIQTQAKGTDPAPDAFLKAITNVRISGGSGTDTYGSAEPSAIIIHPTDYQSLALLTDTLGRYIFGDPSKPDDFTIWGIKPTITSAISQGTSLVGDFLMYSGVWLRKGVTIDMGWNNDDFGKFIRSIRGQLRAGLTVYRPGAFCQVTGL